MDLKSVFCVLLTISSSLAQENYKYLAEFELSLREDKIPSILNILLNNSLEIHDIKTEDIVKLSKLDQYNYDSTIPVFNYFNISAKEAFTVDNLEKLLNIFRLEFGDFFRNLTSKLQLTTEQSEQIIRDLSIPENFWVGISLNRNDRIFDSLRQGNYTEEYVAAALKTSGKDRNQVYNSARDIILVKTLELNSSAFMNILKEQGWNQRVALRMYEALNITTLDVYRVEKFRNIFENITNDLNANTTFGVFIGPNQIAIHDLVYKYFLEKVDSVNVKVEVDGLEVIVRRSNILGERIIELTTLQPGSGYIEIWNSTTVGNCSYVFKSDGLIRKQEVEVDDLKIKKSDSTVFVLGNPLICNDKLYGLAANETEKEIIFDGFYTESSPPPEDDSGESGEENRGHLFLSLFSLTFTLITMLCTL